MLKYDKIRILGQCCVNVVAMLLPNIETNCRQCCVNIVARLIPKFGDQCWNKVQAMLGEYCGNVTPQTWKPTLRQHSGTLVWILWQCHSPTLGANVKTTSRQHFVNVVTMLLSNTRDRCWDYVQAMLCEHCGNITLKHWGLTLGQHWDNVTYQRWFPMLYQCWALLMYQHSYPTLYLIVSGPKWLT